MSDIEEARAGLRRALWRGGWRSMCKELDKADLSLGQARLRAHGSTILVDEGERKWFASLEVGDATLDVCNSDGDVYMPKPRPKRKGPKPTSALKQGRNIRLSDDDVELIQQCAGLAGVGWTTYVGRIMRAHCEQLLAGDPRADEMSQ